MRPSMMGFSQAFGLSSRDGKMAVWERDTLVPVDFPDVDGGLLPNTLLGVVRSPLHLQVS